MCAVLEISTKTYYKYRNKEDPDYYDYLIIKEIFDDSKGTYGYRRIVDGLLQKYGVIMNGKKERQHSISEKTPSALAVLSLLYADTVRFLLYLPTVLRPQISIKI